ncbi:Thioredoxin-like 2 [Seminavis robusta]|uniref:Thioredoxin-like 2 n=1 Tax=Seminavis robusta TaxID=568900 RepID=A0A9N8EB90_9STRA|nr:Thioredoxin-like 2 [Seminavis robusta]|eukprot:Sro756_g197730.1 Thioredoxin-like 2 (215) ;mRNA; r:14893-15537
MHSFQCSPSYVDQPSSRLSARGRSNTVAYYSNTADPPLSEEKIQKSFGKRMRDLVVRQDRQKKQKNSKAINPAKPPFVYEAVSLQTYKEMVADEQDRLVVVRFYAKWCRACKAVEPLFYRMAHSMPDVKFVEVPVLEENANLHQGLEVPSLPYGHIYSPTAGLVEEIRMVKPEFKSFQKVVETYRAGECADLEMDPETGLFLSPFVSKGGACKK